MTKYGELEAQLKALEDADEKLHEGKNCPNTIDKEWCEKCIYTRPQWEKAWDSVPRWIRILNTIIYKTKYYISKITYPFRRKSV